MIINPLVSSVSSSDFLKLKEMFSFSSFKQFIFSVIFLALMTYLVPILIIPIFKALLRFTERMLKFLINKSIYLFIKLKGGM